jgi:hypothetical protein
MSKYSLKNDSFQGYFMEECSMHCTFFLKFNSIQSVEKVTKPKKEADYKPKEDYFICDVNLFA